MFEEKIVDTKFFLKKFERKNCKENFGKSLKKNVDTKKS
jgi:hypothetical protein